jgi:hypothetical protein
MDDPQISDIEVKQESQIHKKLNIGSWVIIMSVIGAAFWGPWSGLLAWMQGLGGGFHIPPQSIGEYVFAALTFPGYAAFTLDVLFSNFLATPNGQYSILILNPVVIGGLTLGLITFFVCHLIEIIRSLRNR